VPVSDAGSSLEPLQLLLSKSATPLQDRSNPGLLACYRWDRVARPLTRDSRDLRSSPGPPAWEGGLL
jgi:hypothetical protein